MRLALPLMLGVFALGTKAGAQAVPPPDAGLDGHGFSPAPVDGDVRDPLVVNRIGGWSPRQAFVSGLFEYAESPLLWCARRYHDSTCLVQERLLDDVYALNLNGGYALNSRLRLYSTVPLFMASESDHRPNGGGFGDIRLGGQAALFREGPLQVGFMPWLDLPTGNETFFLGDTGVSAGAAVAGSIELDALTLSSDLGLELAPQNAFEPTGADQLLVGLAAGYVLADDWGVTLETRLNPRLQASVVAGDRIPTEMLYSVRHKRPEGLHLQLGAAHAVSSGPRAAQYRLFFGVGFTQNSSADVDGDGLVHHLDQCPFEAETLNGWDDDDGCPEDPVFFDVQTFFAGAPVDDVSYSVDGAVPNTTPGSFVSSPGANVDIEARADACLLGTVKTTVEPRMGTVPVQLAVTHGTLRVSLVYADGTPVQNATLTWAAQGESSPCRPTGTVALGPHGRLTTVVGATQQRFVVSAPGLGSRVQTVEIDPQRTARVNVVMDAPRMQLLTDAIDLTENLWFHYNSVEIPSESLALVEELAAMMLQHPEITKIQVVGHTDAQGTPEYNLDLSTRRAQAVIKQLVAHGVDPSRLEPVGLGEDTPTATNRTARGRARNRRVEFLVVPGDV